MPDVWLCACTIARNMASAEGLHSRLDYNEMVRDMGLGHSMRIASGTSRVVRLRVLEVLENLAVHKTRCGAYCGTFTTRMPVLVRAQLMDSNGSETSLSQEASDAAASLSTDVVERAVSVIPPVITLGVYLLDKQHPNLHLPFLSPMVVYDALVSRYDALLKCTHANTEEMLRNMQQFNIINRKLVPMDHIFVLDAWLGAMVLPRSFWYVDGVLADAINDVYHMAETYVGYAVYSKRKQIKHFDSSTVTLMAILMGKQLRDRHSLACCDAWSSWMAEYFASPKMFLAMQRMLVDKQEELGQWLYELNTMTASLSAQHSSDKTPLVKVVRLLRWFNAHDRQERLCRWLRSVYAYNSNTWGEHMLQGYDLRMFCDLGWFAGSLWCTVGMSHCSVSRVSWGLSSRSSCVNWLDLWRRSYDPLAQTFCLQNALYVCALAHCTPALLYDVHLCAMFETWFKHKLVLLKYDKAGGAGLAIEPNTAKAENMLHMVYRTTKAVVLRNVAHGAMIRPYSTMVHNDMRTFLCAMHTLLRGDVHVYGQYTEVVQAMEMIWMGFTMALGHGMAAFGVRTSLSLSSSTLINIHPALLNSMAVPSNPCGLLGRPSMSTLDAYGSDSCLDFGGLTRCDAWVRPFGVWYMVPLVLYRNTDNSHRFVPYASYTPYVCDSVLADVRRICVAQNQRQNDYVSQRAKQLAKSIKGAKTPELESRWLMSHIDVSMLSIVSNALANVLHVEWHDMHSLFNSKILHWRTGEYEDARPSAQLLLVAPNRLLAQYFAAKFYPFPVIVASKMAAYLSEEHVAPRKPNTIVCLASHMMSLAMLCKLFMQIDIANFKSVSKGDLPPSGVCKIERMVFLGTRHLNTMQSRVHARIFEQVCEAFCAGGSLKSVNNVGVENRIEDHISWEDHHAKTVAAADRFKVDLGFWRQLLVDIITNRENILRITHLLMAQDTTYKHTSDGGTQQVSPSVMIGTRPKFSTTQCVHNCECDTGRLLLSSVATHPTEDRHTTPGYGSVYRTPYGMLLLTNTNSFGSTNVKWSDIRHCMANEIIAYEMDGLDMSNLWLMIAATMPSVHLWIRCMSRSVCLYHRASVAEAMTQVSSALSDECIMVPVCWCGSIYSGVMDCGELCLLFVGSNCGERLTRFERQCPGVLQPPNNMCYCNGAMRAAHAFSDFGSGKTRLCFWARHLDVQLMPDMLSLQRDLLLFPKLAPCALCISSEYCGAPVPWVVLVVARNNTVQQVLCASQMAETAITLVNSTITTDTITPVPVSGLINKVAPAYGPPDGSWLREFVLYMRQRSADTPGTTRSSLDFLYCRETQEQQQQ